MEVYGGQTTIHLGGRDNFVLLPIIPARAAAKAAKAKAGKSSKTIAKKKRR
jgi:hypothetical protein